MILLISAGSTISQEIEDILKYLYIIQLIIFDIKFDIC